jgi:metal-responsive CopG/Arc/MetJ family transcriptional regulator
MRTVQMTLEDDLVKSIDLAAKRLHTSRSAFTRSALRDALRNLMTRQMEERHRQGYLTHPISKEEAGVWEKEHAWGDR